MSRDRIPPQSLEAERAALGAMMVDRALVPVVLGIAKPEHFYAPAHVMIANAIAVLDAKSKPIDKITVAEYLRDNGDLERAGGPSYLSTLLDAVQTASSATYYATIVAEKARLRRLIAAGKAIYDLGFEGEDDAGSAVAQAEALLRSAIGESASKDGFTVGEIARKVFAEVEAANAGTAPLGILSPWRMVDFHTGGFHPGELAVWAGAPGVGKTAAIMQLAEHAAAYRGTVAVFALEMGWLNTVRRMMASHAALRVQDLRAGKVVGVQWDRIGTAMSDLATLPMRIYGRTPRKSVADVRRICRRLADEESLAMVVIDHAGFLAESVAGGARTSRHERLDAVYQELLMIADECNVSMHIVQHLNRAGMTGRPTLAALRDGGNLEGHATSVIFPYRDDQESQPTNGEFIIGKNRDGKTGIVPMRYDGERFAWGEYAALGATA